MKTFFIILSMLCLGTGIMLCKTHDRRRDKYPTRTIVHHIHNPKEAYV